LITKAQFVAALTNNGYPSPTDEQYKNLISRAGPAGKITEKRELAMFLANVLLESDGLKAKAEYNPPAGAYQYPTFDVPGQKYYGRGYLMLSWYVCLDERFNSVNDILFSGRTIIERHH
jgi:hypothetical protein